MWNRMWTGLYKPTSPRYPMLNNEQLPGMAATLAKEYFTDADTYLVELPYDDPKSKAAILTGLLMYDMIFAENGGRRSRN